MPPVDPYLACASLYSFLKGRKKIRSLYRIDKGLGDILIVRCDDLLAKQGFGLDIPLTWAGYRVHVIRQATSINYLLQLTPDEAPWLKC